MIAGSDASLAGLALGPVRSYEIAKFEIGYIAVRHLALARIDLSNRRAIHEQQVESEMVAVSHRSHDNTAPMIAPIVGGHIFARMVVRNRLTNKAANRTLIEDCGLIAQHVNDRLVAQALLIPRIDLRASILVDASTCRSRSHGVVSVASAAWRIKS